MSDNPFDPDPEPRYGGPPGSFDPDPEIRYGNSTPLPTVKACPCLHTTPCHSRCTCIEPLSSVGCSHAIGKSRSRPRPVRSIHICSRDTGSCARRSPSAKFVTHLRTSGHSSRFP